MKGASALERLINTLSFYMQMGTPSTNPSITKNNSNKLSTGSKKPFAITWNFSMILQNIQRRVGDSALINTYFLNTFLTMLMPE